MKTLEIVNPPLLFVRELLIGDEVEKSNRTLADLKDIFQDKQSYETIAPETLLYEVYCYLPEKEGTMGALNFGITHIYPGKIGLEYFMTKGHFHAQDDRAEYYWGIEGEGVLILMDRQRNTWGEKMFLGSLHYIPGGVAHRVANTGNTVLSFGACWPSDAGHNYEEIAQNGFSARLMEVEGIPQLV
ncbi:glucose-6-phosphate isomerase [Parabacteroides sp. PF5-5]|uniref:glucose-6-phosphate isomerase family protein n=1 Tax=unclassified Parabacteroides TaxID=2649774 RepID=UPI0024748937|nr:MULTISPECIES: glucose-6-phosphate isomerase family protein [unclassified Parabacteroides]MDH6306527.1 glucose-6-phosphate isomerase [Parabacteroides sp. PH5-39]MDH6317494.1 glucose-6-phosphate isomerase [Parabacteroides sp. PF5-13]MDH6321203.1 glucose-6-phosphate isomerase [Parabacteroides sp. PH5-13]MDH6324935.1 glucose-6-phosphate isomerase [Parabacteroides sp. PH5-8]MDH6328644.1 glucose-6-phosphate isomerase [Parabacteroides sp. PH5-41]